MLTAKRIQSSYHPDHADGADDGQEQGIGDDPHEDRANQQHAAIVPRFTAGVEAGYQIERSRASASAVVTGRGFARAPGRTTTASATS